MRLYMIAPKDHEHLASVTVAGDRDMAEQKARMYFSSPELKDLDMKVFDLTAHFETSGYAITIEQSEWKGMYH
jgi:hypothetical protein